MARLTGDFEESVLMAILHLGNDTYGVPLRRRLEEVTGRMVSVGALYTTLDRLEQKGFVSSRQSEPTPERGGRSKRYFQVTGLGEAALAEKQVARERMLSGLGLRPAGGAA